MSIQPSSTSGALQSNFSNYVFEANKKDIDKTVGLESTQTKTEPKSVSNLLSTDTAKGVNAFQTFDTKGGLSFPDLSPKTCEPINKLDEMFKKLESNPSLKTPNDIKKAIMNEISKDSDIITQDNIPSLLDSFADLVAKNDGSLTQINVNKLVNEMQDELMDNLFSNYC